MNGARLQTCRQAYMFDYSAATNAKADFDDDY
jgi:hypothetical protein